MKPIPIKITDLQLVLAEQPAPNVRYSWFAYSFQATGTSPYVGQSVFPLPSQLPVGFEIPFSYRPEQVIISLIDNDDSAGRSLMLFWGVAPEETADLNDIHWRAIAPWVGSNPFLGVRRVATSIGDDSVNFNPTNTALAFARSSQVFEFTIPKVKIPENYSFYFQLRMNDGSSFIWADTCHLTIIVKEVIPQP